MYDRDTLTTPSALEHILRSLDNEQTVFVFPSEITAASVRRGVLLHGPKKAVRSDRFISWDRFKEDVFTLTRTTRPVNSIHRLLFLASLFGQNEEDREEVFRYFFNADFRAYHGGLVKSYAAVLPGLKRFFQVFDASRESGVPGNLISDLRFLFHEYSAFLARNSLFEPGYEAFGLSSDTVPKVIFFPGIIQDFQEFRSALEGTSRIDFFSAPPPKTVSFRFFPNALLEVKHLLFSLEALLDAGTPPEELAITIADQDIIPVLDHEADLRGIIFDSRIGAPLCDYPAGRLLALLQQVSSTDFNLDSVQNLVLNRRFPWKDPGFWKQLVDFGIQQHCIRGRRLWEERLRAYGGETLSKRFSRFAAALQRMTRAGTFGSLKQQFMAFVGEYFEAEGWKPEDLNILQTCILVLSDCVAAEQSLSGLGTFKPYTLFLQILSSQVYVQPGSNRGIRLYPYRVSAGIQAANHFVVGVSEESVSVRMTSFPFLRDDHKDKLGLPDVDQTEPFLHVYGGCGAEVYFSGSRKARGGTKIIPSYFTLRDSVTLVEEADVKPDRYMLERSFWFNRECAGFPDRLHRIQTQGFSRAIGTTLSSRRVDCTRVPVSLPESLGREQPVTITPTGLELYVQCPFSYLFQEVLGIREGQFGPQITDPRREGIIYHAILTLLFRELQNRGESVGKVKRDDLNTLLPGCIEEVFSRWQSRGKVYVPPVLSVFKATVKEHLEQFLYQESAGFADFVVEGVEKEFTGDPGNGTYILNGRIDRISQNDGAFLLVDYKKRNRLTRNDLFGDEPVSFQMPLYYHLAKINGMEAQYLSYYVIEEDRYLHILHPHVKRPWTDAEGIRGAEARMLKEAERMADGLRGGNYTVPGDDKGCVSCRYRMVCRERYYVR